MPDLYAELHALGPRRNYERTLPVPQPGYVLVKIERCRPLTDAAYRLFQYYVLGEWPRGDVSYVEINAGRVAELEQAMRELPTPTR